MRSVWMMMNTTLDGVAAFPEYPEDPAAAAAFSDHPMYSPHMASLDTIFLGRFTYEAWADFWPTQENDPAANPFNRSFSRFANRADKVVFSKTLAKADWPKSRIVRGDVRTEVARLKELPGKDMAVLGGPRLAQSFLESDLVDELLLMVSPSLVRRGKPLFRVAADPVRGDDRVPIGAVGRLDFTPVEARVLPDADGQLLLWYRRSR